MAEDEIPLHGGNATTGVVRVGSTVRKPWTSSTEAVVKFVSSLVDAGIDAPLPLGRDERGRQIIEFVPGQLAEDAGPLSLADLTRVGRMVREIHDASEGLSSSDTAWEILIPSRGTPNLICHNDLAPWNLIIGDRWVFIDWDGAGPSNRVWDLAYAAQAFTLNDATEAPAHAAERLRAFIDGYGADQTLRAQLPRVMAERAAAMHDLLRAAHETDRQPWSTMYLAGHGAHWRAAADYVSRNRAVWETALVPAE
ncbi:phosphotransferase [Agromyces sp. Marseille-Q5079]|uniref:phosphotransferase n=1 Tax=Agromyces sp. Marseille-Q5079 TaxID=3439059 RepID=UPI003D9CAF0E